MTGSVYRRCEHGPGCADLARKGHGSYTWADRLPTLEGRQLIRRGGFTRQKDATDAMGKAHELLGLAGGDDRARQQIGSLIRDRTMRGGALPDKAIVARRLGLGADPGEPGVMFADAWAGYLAGKRKLRPSSRRRLEQIGAHWLLPALADVSLERLNGQHCADVFDRIDAINAEVAAQKADGRAWVHAEGDTRQVPNVISTASMHRVYAALQGFLTHEVRKTRRLAFNPIYAVELEPEPEYEADWWTEAQTVQFLAATADHPLALVFRIVAIHGPRRGEVLGFRWATSDLEAGYLGVRKTVLQIGGKVTEGTPKTRAGLRKLFLDDGSLTLAADHRKAQVAMRLPAGGAWQDNDLVFCREDGSAWPPDYVSRRWKAAAKAAGVPVIRFHDGRHTSVTAKDEAGIDKEVSRDQTGHAGQAIHEHYTHRAAAKYRDAANQLAAHIESAAL